MAKKRKKYLVTAKNSEAYACRLVTSPAVEETFVSFAEDKPLVEKFADQKKHMITGVVAIPNKPIYRRNADGEEYDIVFSAEAIESMAKDFLKEYRQHNVTLQHEEDAEGIYLCEQWIKTDAVYDKSLAIGLSKELPVGSWIQTYYVDSNDVWGRIESGELRGFSLECLLGLEEFEKQIKEDKFEIDMSEDTFWSKLKNIMSEAFGKGEKATIEDLAANSGFTNIEDYKNEVEAIKEELEEQTPNEAVETPQEQPKDEQPTHVKEEVKEEPTEAKNEPTEVVEPKKDDSHLEELINNLNEEIKALKEMNSGLQDKIKALGKQPSSKPLNTNAKANPTDTYTAWRRQMAEYLK